MKPHFNQRASIEPRWGIELPIHVDRESRQKLIRTRNTPNCNSDITFLHHSDLTEKANKSRPGLIWTQIKQIIQFALRGGFILTSQRKLTKLFRNWTGPERFETGSLPLRFDFILTHSRKPTTALWRLSEPTRTPNGLSGITFWFIMTKPRRPTKAVWSWSEPKVHRMNSLAFCFDFILT